MRKVDKRQAVETIQTLYPQGWTLDQLAAKLGITKPTVQWHMVQIGMERRPKGRRSFVRVECVTS